MNMHWDSHDLAFPKLPKGMEWELAFSTEREGNRKEDREEEGDQLLRQVPPRSIAMYVAKRERNV